MLAARAFRHPLNAASHSRARYKVAARPGLHSPDSFQGNDSRRVPASIALGKAGSHRRKRCSYAAAPGTLSDIEGQFPLHAAVRIAHTAEAAEDTIKQLLAAGHPVNQPDDKGNYPLHFAAINPYPEVAPAAIRLLCAAGASADAAVAANSMRPLHHAVLFNSNAEAAAAAVTALLEAGANVNAPAAGNRTPLHTAASCEDADVIKAVIPLLLGAGAAINKRTTSQSTALHAAVFNNDPRAARVAICLLVAGGADVNAANEHGKQPLHIASECSNLAIVLALLAAGGYVKAQCQDGLTALHYAAKSNSKDSAADCITVLVAAGADVHALDKHNKCPLGIAVHNSDPDVAMAIATALWEAGARYYEFNDDIQDFYGFKDLSEIMVITVVTHLDRQVVERRTPSNQAAIALSDAAGQYPLHAAVFTAHTAKAAEDTIKQLLAAGHPVNQPDDKGSYPLHFAAINPYPEVAAAAIRLLVAAGADVAARDGSGNQPLHWALKDTYSVHRLANVDITGIDYFFPGANISKCTDAVQALLEAGADVAAKDGDNMEALHLAAFHTSSGDMAAVIALLLVAGARVDAATFPRSGYTPIHLAVRNPDAEAAASAIRLLTVAGACPSAAAVHEKGFQPLHIVHLNPNPAAATAAVKALLAAGADANGVRTDGMSILHENAIAAKQADAMAAIIPLLLEAGADPNATDDSGGTALHFSASNPNPAAARVAIDLLMAAGTDIRAKDLSDWEPLHLAAKCAGADNIAALLAHGADVNAKGGMDFTPLHCAVMWITSPQLVSECITTLVAADADIEALDNLNQQAIHLAAINKPGSGEVAVAAISALLNASASITAKGGQGGQPLHYAALAHTPEGATAAIKTLLAAGADVNALNDLNWCPLENAFVNRSQDARIAAATALWEAGGHYYSFNKDTQEWVGPGSLAQITGSDPLANLEKMRNDPQIFGILDADMQKALIEAIASRSQLNK